MPMASACLIEGIPRQGCQVLKEGNVIGEVTSGSFSPTLGEGIALILVQTPLKMGDQVAIANSSNSLPR